MQLERLGPYLIVSKLGEGGMGAVYAAVHEETTEQAAVKVLPSALAGRTGFRDRFKTEIETLRKLDHPNIVRIFGWGEAEDSTLFYAMELVDGVSLEGETDGGRIFTWREAVEIGIQTCRALKHAHDRGVVHRDIKPANLMLTSDGRLKLSDFGIAKLYGNSGMTMEGSPIGTANYMSPEQADGGRATERSDLYSMGCMFYTLLTGRPPFEARSLTQMLDMQRFAEPPNLRHRAADTPEELAAVVARLLRKNPDERPANAGVLLKSLQMVLRSQALLAGEVPPETPDEGSDDAPKDVAQSRVVPITYTGPRQTAVAGKSKVSSQVATQAQTRLSPATSQPTSTDNATIANTSPAALRPIEPTTNDVTAVNTNAPAVSRVPTTPVAPPQRPPEPPATQAEEPVSGATVVRDPTSQPLRPATVQPPPKPADESVEAYELTDASNAPAKGGGTASVRIKAPATFRPDNADAGSAVPAVGTHRGAAADELDLADEEPVADSAAGQFTTADEAIRREAELARQREEDEARAARRWAIRALVAVVLVIAVLIASWIGYVSHRNSADTLYATIKAAAATGDADTLEDAETTIRDFLHWYPDDQRAAEVKQYAEELELQTLDRQAKVRAKRLLNIETRSPIERSYLEAMSYANVEPEKGVIKLQALLDLFQNAKVSEEDQRYLTLAARQRKKLNETVMQHAGTQIMMIRQRLDNAEKTRESDPETARRICQGVIELFEAKPWAETHVKRARSMLASLPPPATTQPAATQP